MADTKQENSNIFRKVLQATEAVLDEQIAKSKASLQAKEAPDHEDFLFGKAVTEDSTYAIHSSGWKEKPQRLMNHHLKAMAQKDSIIAAVIQTRQNQVSNYSKLVDSDKEKGWILRLRDEEQTLAEIKAELRAKKSTKPETDLKKAKADETEAEPQIAANEADTKDDADEKIDWELERKAKAILKEKFAEERRKVEQYLLNCGYIEKEDFEKPFHAKAWTLDPYLRALVRDTLIYDLYATEIVLNNDNTPAYFFPVDAATVKFSSERFADYKSNARDFNNLSLLYPEGEAKAREDAGILELNPVLVERNAYKYVQVVAGRIERAFTEQELKVGIRNPTTDIYAHGYGISELELLVALVTSHLNAEFYNQAYFTQGFSAKGILHIKAAMNRRKLDALRQQWYSMLRGSKNSFQTPIFAGVDDVQWIPLTQNHDDIGFDGWMRYLAKMICAIYQIDPQEIGLGMKEEGGSGSGMSGDNTREKIEHSKDKGLYPLLRHLQEYLNENIVKPFNDKFVLEFVGITSETPEKALARAKDEAGFLKTLNEIRAEHGLPPLPGCDDVILNPTYMSWYNQFSETAQKKNAADAVNEQIQNGPGGGEDGEPGDEAEPQNQPPDQFDPYANPEEFMNWQDGDEDVYPQQMQAMKKSRKIKPVKIEYYRIG